MPRPYPGLDRATIEMAYDNGGVNRDHSEADVLRALDTEIDKSGLSIAHDLPAINAWLRALSDDDLQTVLAGEQTDQEHLIRDKCAPAGTDMLLCHIFDHVV